MADTNGASESVVGASEITVETNGKEDSSLKAKEVSTVEVCDSDEKITDLEAKIIRQVEYYFGDNNLPKDKFLQEQIKLDDGWVPLSVLLTFKRLANMSLDPVVIATAVEKSESLLVKVSEDKSKVRRAPEMVLPEQNEERRKELMSRTVYIKGFPVATTLDKVLDCLKGYDFVENVVMRTYPDKATKTYLFKGSVFALFKTKEQCETFLALDKVEYEGKELIRKWQQVYLEEEKSKRGADKRKNKNDKEDNVKEENKLPKGAVIHMDGFPETCTREDIKEVVVALGGDVAFVDFNKGDKSGWVRLHGIDTAKTILEKMDDKKTKIGESEITCRVLEGEEESTFLDKVAEDMKKRRAGQSGRGNRGGRGGRGGKGGGGGWNNRKRKGSPSRGPPTKH